MTSQWFRFLIGQLCAASFQATIFKSEPPQTFHFSLVIFQVDTELQKKEPETKVLKRDDTLET